MTDKAEEKDVRHPEGKIVLMNGTVLECHPKEDIPVTIIKDELALDTTGEYLQLSRGQRKPLKKPSPEPWKELFYREAFFLYEHREQILSDSRMFLTPLLFENVLAYTGPSGLRNATLGIYLEWWEECEGAVIRKDGEVQALTYIIAGSPLTGSNRCSAVDREGRRMTVCLLPRFSQYWRSFMQINQRYTEAKQLFQTYTLEETVAKLREGRG